VRRLEGLVNDFLSYARPTEPRLEPRDLNALVEEIVRFLRAELQQKEIAIEVVLPPSLPLVPIDEAQLRQAVMNILINAMEVLRPGGKIEIATGVASPSDVFLRITDDGPGIPEEIRRRIFEVFFSTRGGGTGLGLPIAQKIVAAHGGRIEMTTQLGKGTTFVLHLPRAPRAEPRPATAAVHAR
jgi:signal transduction histidine kinase